MPGLHGGTARGPLPGKRGRQRAPQTEGNQRRSPAPGLTPTAQRGVSESGNDGGSMACGHVEPQDFTGLWLTSLGHSFMGQEKQSVSKWLNSLLPWAPCKTTGLETFEVGTGLLLNCGPQPAGSKHRARLQGSSLAHFGNMQIIPQAPTALT